MPIKTFRRLKTRHAPKESFASHVLTLMTGTTIAQAIPIAIAPILTRLYTPSDFGVFALFGSVISIVAIIANGRYELAIMLPENDSDAVNLLALSILISFAVSFLSLLIVFAFNSQIVSLLGNPTISSWLYWVPFSVLLTGIYQAFNYWSTRKKHFDRLAISRISQSFSTATANLLFGYGRVGVSGLVGGSLIGQSCATGVLAWQVWRDDKSKRELISKKNIAKIAKKYREFPLINSLHAFADAVQTSGIVFVISAFFGSSILGLYSFTLRVLRMPLSLIGSSVSQVFFQKASQTYNEGGNLHVLLNRTMLKLAIIALPIFGIIILFAPDIFSSCFGKNWHDAGVYAQILSPWIFLNFIVSPIAGTYLIVGKQKQAIWFAASDIVTKLGSVAIGAYLGDAVTGFSLMSISGVITLIVDIIWTYKISSERNKR